MNNLIGCKLSQQALICLVKTFQKGLLEMKDISQILKELEFEVINESKLGEQCFHQLNVTNPEITELDIPNVEDLMNNI